jgi:hypothetical protein
MFKRYFDGNSGKYYYHNSLKNLTSWTLPDDPNIICQEYIDPALQKPISVMVANFDKKSGSFSNLSNSYDREAKQMSAFFDVSLLDQNRAEAKIKQKKLRESGIKL